MTPELSKLDEAIRIYDNGYCTIAAPGIQTIIEAARAYAELQKEFKNFGAGEITDPLVMIKWLRLAYDNLLEHATGQPLPPAPKEEV